VFTFPLISDFKAQFFRDFNYGTTMDTIQDQDITNALAQAVFNFNYDLFSSQDQVNLAGCFLTAHYLVIDFQNSSQGLASQYNWLLTSKSVGSVSAGYTIPQYILDNPEFAYLSTTGYGVKYLSLIMPLLIGNMFSVFGGTNP
jgi:hypothetical protein